MFCCQPQTLYLTQLKVDPFNFDFEEDLVSLSERLKKNSVQTLLPKSMELTLNLTSENSQLQSQVRYQQAVNQFSEYKIEFSEQTHQLVIEELIRDPPIKVWKVLLKKQQQQMFESDSFSFDYYQFQVYKLPKKYRQALGQQEIMIEDKCRICFGCQVSQKNPLLNLCNCAGTIKFMHLQCVRQWLKEGLEIRNGTNYSIYQFKKSQCNICKSRWKKRVNHNKKQYYIYDLEIQNNQSIDSLIDYNFYEQNRNHKELLLTMENFHQLDHQQHQPQGFLMLRVKIQQSNDNEQHLLTMGKQLECDIILEQLYLQSGIQCSIKFKDGKLFLRDSDSVNGTCVSIQNVRNTTFSTRQGLHLRFDNKIMKIKGKNSIFPCFQPEILYKVKYKAFKQ